MATHYHFHHQILLCFSRFDTGITDSSSDDLVLFASQSYTNIIRNIRICNLYDTMCHVLGTKRELIRA